MPFKRLFKDKYSLPENASVVRTLFDLFFDFLDFFLSFLTLAVCNIFVLWYSIQLSMCTLHRTIRKSFPLIHQNVKNWKKRTIKAGKLNFDHQFRFYEKCYTFFFIRTTFFRLKLDVLKFSAISASNILKTFLNHYNHYRNNYVIIYIVIFRVTYKNGK